MRVPKSLGASSRGLGRSLGVNEETEEFGSALEVQLFFPRLDTPVHREKFANDMNVNNGGCYVE